MATDKAAPLGVILAGGRSRRMGGGDKALLPLAGKALIAHVIDRLAPQVAAVAINANGAPTRFAPFGLPVFGDSVPDFAGPLAGVLAGLDFAVDRGHAHIITAAADTPFLPRDLVSRLTEGIGDAPLALAATRAADGRLWRHPTFGLWSVALRDDLRKALAAGTRKVVAFTDERGSATVPFPTKGGDPFFNVNTPEDMIAAAGLLKDDV